MRDCGVLYSSNRCCKVHIFWEGHKILRNLHLTFVQCQSKVRWRYRKILWPFQNIWALRNDTSFESSESFPPFFHRNHGRSSGLLFPTKSSPFISINYSDFIYPFFACDFKLDFLFYWISLLLKFNWFWSFPMKIFELRSNFVFIIFLPKFVLYKSRSSSTFFIWYIF